MGRVPEWRFGPRGLISRYTNTGNIWGNSSSLRYFRPRPLEARAYCGAWSTRERLKVRDTDSEIASRLEQIDFAMVKIWTYTDLLCLPFFSCWSRHLCLIALLFITIYTCASTSMMSIMMNAICSNPMICDFLTLQAAITSLLYFAAYHPESASTHACTLPAIYANENSLFV